jgi:hypothetical protein
MLRVLSAPAGLDAPARQPVIHDPAEAPVLEAGDLVLAIGTPVSTPAAEALVRATGQSGATAVVFRGDARPPPGLEMAAGSAGVAILAAAPEVAWSQLHTLVRTAVAVSGDPRDDSDAGGPIGDLFSLANAIATMVGGPTTIEDPQSTVLAYSSLGETVDEHRRDTILGRRVPEAWRRRLQADGVFRRVWSEPDVVRIEYPDEDPPLHPRLVIGVRAGGEILGSIWVAEQDRRLDSRSERALVEAAGIAALHLIRARSGEDLERERRSGLLLGVLEGSTGPEALADALEAHGPAFITVIGLRLSCDDSSEVTLRARKACRLIDQYCESRRLLAAVAATGPVVYLLTVDRSEKARPKIASLARDVIERCLDTTHASVAAGIGSTRLGLQLAGQSRVEADRVLRVLSSGTTGVALIEEVRSHTILDELRTLASQHPSLLEGELNVLGEHDRQHRSDYVRTLRAFLDSFGDVTAAAAIMGVHPNTFRYRLRRLTEVIGMDLEDPIARLVLHLQLHLR